MVLFLIVSDTKMGKRKKVVVNKERTIKGMANAVSSDEGEGDGQDMVSHSFFSFDIALWVKQCNYKDCKVFKSKTLVRLHFSSEIIQTFFK